MKAGWKTINLEQLCDVFADGDWIESKDQSPTGIRLIQTGNVGNGVFKDRAEKARYISEDTFLRLRCSEILEGDCLVSRLPDPVARSCIIPSLSEKCITAVDCTIIRFDRSKIIPEFFNYFSQSREYAAAVAGSVGGATRQRISRKNLGLLRIPVPPIEEQRQTVAVLDKAFAGIATATANAQTNLTNARLLFESYLDTIVTTQDETWYVGKLEDIGGSVSTGPFGSLLHKSDYVENGIPLVNPAHIIGERIEPDYRKSVSAKTLSALSAYVLHEGDIVIGRRGDIGRCAVITELENGWLCGTGCFFIRPKKSANPLFLAHLLRSNPYRKVLEVAASGATMLNLSNTALSELEIALPKLECQNRFLEKLDVMSKYVSKLEVVAADKLTALSELKQSLLQKAFAGELA